MKHQTGETGWPSGNTLDFHGGADCWSYGVQIPVGKRNLFVYIYRPYHINAMLLYVEFMCVLLTAGVKNGTLKQSKGTGASGSFCIGEKERL